MFNAEAYTNELRYEQEMRVRSCCVMRIKANHLITTFSVDPHG